ncbi:hypothetical protein [Rhizobium leguminosarum]|uniref:hypothetical protein n=1 Tax=Rhizobium leguminosarum TaxID=384 RepID=UPI003F9C6AD9
MSKTYATQALYVDDVQCAKRLNLPRADTEFFKYYEDKHGFPKREPDFANKRYWPAVVAWFDHEFGIGDRRPYFRDERPDWEKYPSKKKRKTRWGE